MSEKVSSPANPLGNVREGEQSLPIHSEHYFPMLSEGGLLPPSGPHLDKRASPEKEHIMSFSEEPGVSHQVPKILHSHVQDSMDSMVSCSAYIYIYIYIHIYRRLGG